MNRELLPWYVNGTLDDVERAAVERELAESAEARQELALWQAIAADTARQATQETAADAGGIDLGWLRLERQLRASPKPQARRWSLAAAAALLAMLGAETLYISRLQQAHDAEIRQLSASPVDVRADEWRVQVRFRGEASIDDINALLLAIDARVIAGPSALGIYELAVPHSTRFADAPALARWLSEQAIVEQGTAPP